LEVYYTESRNTTTFRVLSITQKCVERARRRRVNLPFASFRLFSFCRKIWVEGLEWAWERLRLGWLGGWVEWKREWEWERSTRKWQRKRDGESTYILVGK